MFYLIFHVIPIFYTVATAAAAGYSKDVNVKGIVNDLIENWEPPFSYLKSRGYLSEDLPSAPVLQDFQQLLQDNSGQELALEKGSKRGLDQKVKKCDERTYRSTDEPVNQDLKNMFRNLFSSEGEYASDKLKSKLNVDWDMNALKNSAQESAAKYLKSLKKPVKQEEHEEEPFFKKPLAQEPQHKEPIAEDALLKQPVSFDSPKYPSDLPKVLKRLAMWRPKKETKPENQEKYF